MRWFISSLALFLFSGFFFLMILVSPAPAQGQQFNTLTPQDNLCYYGQAWDNLCNSTDPITRHWQWRAGWYFFRYLRGEFLPTQIPTEFHDLLNQMPTQRPSATPLPNTINQPNIAPLVNPTANPRVQCGNGVLDNGEVCDFAIANQPRTGQTCNNTCSGFAPVCGDGIVVIGESCEDGNTVSGDGCSSACQVE